MGWRGFVGWGGECVTPVLVRSLKLSTLVHASNWIGVQTGVHGFDSRTPHKPVISKTSEADIWLSSYDHLTDVGGLSTTLAAKGCVLSTQQERSYKWIDPSE